MLTKHKRAVMLISTLTLLLGAASAPAEEAPPPGEILVVYAEEADAKHEADNLSALGQTLLSLRYTADYVEAEALGDALKDYQNVIWCATADSSRMDASALSGYTGRLMVLGRAAGLEEWGIQPVFPSAQALIGIANYTFEDSLNFSSSVPSPCPGSVPDAAYQAGELRVLDKIVPLSSGTNGFRYIPLTDYTTSFARAVLTREISQWMWPYEGKMHTYTQHIVLNEVYPFFDPRRLQLLVEEMVEKKINFTIAVMPIYEHEDYPAMQQFCEVLRYAQANGGAVVMRYPIIQGDTDMETLAERLTVATQNYFKQDVYILGLEIPSEWLFRPDLYPVLGRYRTLMLAEMDAFSAHAVREYGELRDFIRLGSQQIVPALKIDETGISHVSNCATAVYLDVNMKTDEELLSVISAAKDSPIPMQSLWAMEEAVYLNDGDYLTWDTNTLMVNGTQRFNVFTPREPAENFDYQRNAYYRFVANLTNQNHFLIALSALVLVMLVLLGIRSRRQMHKRFLKRKPGPEGKEE